MGPTNSGKTHAALQALKAADTGIYCGPLRLLAWEASLKQLHHLLDSLSDYSLAHDISIDKCMSCHLQITSCVVVAAKMYGSVTHAVRILVWLAESTECTNSEY